MVTGKRMTYLIKILTAIVDFEYFQWVRGTFFGKEQRLRVLNVYGISFCPPDNSFGLGIAANQYENSIFVVVDCPPKRFTGLKPGELKIGNYLTGAYTYFKEDGSVEIKTSSDLCSMILNPNGTVNITGDVIVSGTVTAENFITEVCTLNTHIHTGDSGGTTSPPIA